MYGNGVVARGILIVTRFFLGLVIVGTALCCPAVAADVTHGKITAMSQVDSPWDKIWDHFKARSAQDSTLELEFYIRGELGTEEEMLGALRRNRVQVGGITMWGLAGLIPEAAIPMIPFLFESTEEVDSIFDNFLVEPFNALLSEKGMVFMQWSEVGWNSLYGNKPFLVPTDTKGVRLRGSPNFAAQAYLTAVEADPVPLGVADIVPALQTGLIDGGLSGLIYFYYSLRDFATDFTETKHSYDQGVEMANKQWWDSLDVNQQRTIKESWMPLDKARTLVRSLAVNLRSEMISEGMAVHRLSPEQRDLWVSATAPTHRQIIQEVGGRAQDIYNAILEGKRAFSRNLAAGESDR